MKLTLRILIFTILVAGMSGCNSGNSSKCFVGDEIVIPSADATDPSLAMDFHLPNGKIVTVIPGSTTSTVPVPGGGKVKVIVIAKDSEGIQDSQIWAAEIKTTTDPNTGLVSTTAPPSLAAPTTSNRDNGTAGQAGCSERMASTDLEVRKSPTAGLGYEVHAVGLNFGGKSVRTPLVKLMPQ